MILTTKYTKNTKWNCSPVGRVTPCAPSLVFARTAGRGLPALPLIFVWFVYFVVSQFSGIHD
jgi:hypothetical protein